MGDGRYYTYRQFFQILYLTILSGGLVFTIFYIQMKSREKERIRYIVVSSCFLLLTVILSFIKEVTYELYPAEILTYISLFGVIGATVTQIVYYNKRLVHTCIIAFLLLLATGFHFIDDFTYIETSYSIEYQLLMVVYILVLLVYILKDIRISHKNLRESMKSKGLKRYEWLESLTIGGGILLVSTSYCLFILLNITFPLHELSLVVCIIGFNLTFLHFMPHERIPIGYHSLIENMMDTIIIVNEKNQILFMNDTEFSHIINEFKTVDFHNLSTIFDLEDISTIHLSPLVEQINGMYEGQVISCKTTYKRIENKGEHVGYVVVVEDCSDLENMIVDLRAKKQSLTELRSELSKYNQTSQALRAEKERNRLLIEVQNELGHHLAELTKYIGNTIDYTGRVSFEDDEECEYLEDSITQGIAMARMNLSNIRATVKTYRSSYDGKEKRDDKSIISR